MCPFSYAVVSSSTSITRTAGSERWSASHSVSTRAPGLAYSVIDDPFLPVRGWRFWTESYSGGRIFELHAVHQAEGDDVDAERRVVDVMERLEDALLDRYPVGWERARVLPQGSGLVGGVAGDALWFGFHATHCRRGQPSHRSP